MDKNPMDLGTLIITVFCTIDDAMNHCFANQRMRQRGPKPRLTDSEVLTIETVGAFLRMPQDKELFAYFRRHGLHLCTQVEHDPQVSLVDSFPVPVCRFARATRCRTPANIHDLTGAQELLEHQQGFVLADRNYWSPKQQQTWREQDLRLLAPYKSSKREAAPWPRSLVQKRRRIETVIGQLVGRFTVKQVWARDWWHLCSRWLRDLLSHTLCVLLCQRQGLSPLQFAELLAH